jgi:hypothetical protein
MAPTSNTMAGLYPIRWAGATADVGGHVNAEARMDPAVGVVIGVAWGADAASCAAALGPLGGAPADARRPVYRAVTLAGLAWSVELTFELDALVAVALRAVAGAAALDGAALTRVIGLASAWTGAAPVRRDEGYWQAEGGATRLTLDLLEGRLSFEDMDA